MKPLRSQEKTIKGFSKMSKPEKVQWLVENYFDQPERTRDDLMSYWLDDKKQEVIDGISENTITNFILPFSVAPNFNINGQTYCVPMVIEESSVVAAASASAKFWMQRGGFQTQILGTQKVGQVHFLWSGSREHLFELQDKLKQHLLESVDDLTKNMRARGGGVHEIRLLDFSDQLDNYYQLWVTFETCDSMGANFINSVLEAFAKELPDFMSQQPGVSAHEQEVEVIMSILSNYTPNCLVRASVSCPIAELDAFQDCNLSAADFARRFETAVRIAQVDPYRAVTHNKGIMNGIDAVVMATGNDFRAVEAGVHAYASRSGQYRSLSDCQVTDDQFTFSLDIPLAIGTVGGLTKLHPMAKRSLELLGNPGAEELMQIIAAMGLAQNFAALRSLVTTGIQKGHMKMHLSNILIQLGATESQQQAVRAYFADRVVSYRAVCDYFDTLA